MLVEPGSLCWVAGRMVEARDGETWAGELARFSALGTVVRDDGGGVGKGLKLERARRRAEGLSAWIDRHMGVGVGPHGPTDQGATGLAGTSSTGSRGIAWSMACEQPG